jgi:very-short-patch-repair endonuclease
VLFPAERLVIEVDGDRYHSTRFRKESDRRKQVIVEAAGYRVLRVREQDDVVARVLLELGR